MGGRREVSIIFYRPVTRRDLKQERSFFRGSVSSFLQLVVVSVKNLPLRKKAMHRSLIEQLEYLRSRILFCLVLLFSPTPDLTFMHVKNETKKQTSLSTCPGRLEERGTIRKKLTTYSILQYYLTSHTGLRCVERLKLNYQRSSVFWIDVRSVGTSCIALISTIFQKNKISIQKYSLKLLAQRVTSPTL